jgi:GNAT superfamily N-acetyltransferase
MGISEEDVIIEPPDLRDVEAMGRLFYEDMQDLGVDTSLQALTELAELVVRSMEQTPQPCLCWIARTEAGGEPVGVLLVNFNFSLKFAGPSLWIEELYVTPSARRLGIGRMLVEHLLDYAEAEGIKGIDLEAYQGNTPASVLYRSLGFYRLGRERFYYRLGPQEYL